jgi:hypothetical protein
MGQRSQNENIQCNISYIIKQMFAFKYLWYFKFKFQRKKQMQKISDIFNFNSSQSCFHWPAMLIHLILHANQLLVSCEVE